jgi:hypothetical protein
VESLCARPNAASFESEVSPPSYVFVECSLLKDALRCLIGQDVFERPLNVIYLFTDHSN